MKKFDFTLKGVVSCGYNPQSGEFFMFVTRATLNNCHESKWHFPLPPLALIPVDDLSNLTPEDKYALSIIGSEVRVQVFGDELDSLKVKVISVTGRTRRTMDEFVTTVENCAAKRQVEKVDVILCGVVNNGYKKINAKLGTFKMFVVGAIMDFRNESKWQFSLPPLISIHVRGAQMVPPSLKSTGSEALVHVTGKPDALEVEVIYAQSRTSLSLKDLVATIDECAPECPVKVHIDGDFAKQRIRMDA